MLLVGELKIDRAPVRALLLQAPLVKNETVIVDCW